ncbi:MAG: ankyrin repeat domain-containing protein [Brevinematia bacterium]
MKNRKLLIIFLLPLLISNVTLDRSLIVAISKGDFLRVKKLVESGANVNYVYHKGKSALHWAAISGNLKIVAYLLYKGAKINATDINGSTPLQLSAMGRNLDVVKLLVQSGADITHKDKNGWDILHYFVFYEFEIGVKFLLTQGVELTNKTKKKFMEIPEGFTPLDIAVKKNYENIVSILENPVKYTSLSKKAILNYGISYNFGKDNFISPLERGFVILNITNIGGLSATGLKIELKDISNCEDLEFEGEKTIDIPSAESKEVPFFLRGLSSMEKSGKAFFEMHIYENSTNVIPFEVNKLYKPFPSPFISALFHYPFEVLTGNSTNISFKIENRGKGDIENGVFKVSFSGYHLVNNAFEFSNISLPPSGYTNIEIKLETIEDENILNPEIVKAKIIFSSLFDITNIFDFRVMPLSLPEFYSDLGIREMSFTNLYVDDGEENPLTIFISNTTEIEGRNLELWIKTTSFETEFKIKRFPASRIINLFLPSSLTNEEMSIEIFYKKRLLFSKTYNITNEDNISEEEATNKN